MWIGVVGMIVDQGIRNGNVLLRLKGMRASVRVLLSLVMERYWRAVVGIRAFGSGKVSQSCRLSNERFGRRADLIVQPDSDFECIAVMMEHGQDVKSLAWHPHEEVSYTREIQLIPDPRIGIIRFPYSPNVR